MLSTYIIYTLFFYSLQNMKFLKLFKIAPLISVASCIIKGGVSLDAYASCSLAQAVATQYQLCVHNTRAAQLFRGWVISVTCSSAPAGILTLTQIHITFVPSTLHNPVLYTILV